MDAILTRFCLQLLTRLGFLMIVHNFLTDCDARGIQWTLKGAADKQLPAKVTSILLKCPYPPFERLGFSRFVTSFLVLKLLANMIFMSLCRINCHVEQKASKLCKVFSVFAASFHHPSCVCCSYMGGRVKSKRRGRGQERLWCSFVACYC